MSADPGTITLKTAHAGSTSQVPAFEAWFPRATRPRHPGPEDALVMFDDFLTRSTPKTASEESEQRPDPGTQKRSARCPEIPSHLQPYALQVDIFLNPNPQPLPNSTKLGCWWKPDPETPQLCMLHETSKPGGRVGQTVPVPAGSLLELRTMQFPSMHRKV